VLEGRVRVKGQAQSVKGGFTVVETLITLLVIGIAIGTFVQAFVAIKNIAGRGLYVASANSTAYAKLQEYENKTFTSIPATAITSPATVTEQEDFSASLPANIPKPSTAKVYSTSHSNTLKQVFVRVKFGERIGTTDCTGNQRCIEYSTFVQLRGLGK
jgi:type II secretory pathway pseudopilin PulG